MLAPTFLEALPAMTRPLPNIRRLVLIVSAVLLVAIGRPMASEAAAPNLVAVFSLDGQHVLVTFDVDVDVITATNVGNYSFASLSSIDDADLVAPHQVVLTMTTDELDAGSLETLSVSGVKSAATGTPVALAVSQPFHYGVVTPSMIQAPDPVGLAGNPCVDRSRFAGPDSLPGSLVTVLATCVGNYNRYTNAVLSDTVGSVARGGLFVDCPYVPLSYGVEYRVTGRIKENNGNTTLGGVIHADSLYVTPEPMARFDASPPSASVVRES